MSKNSRMEQVRHELLSDVADQVAMVLKDYLVDEPVAEQCGSAIADHLAQHWGGQHITVPMDYSYKLSQRDLEIWEKFDGNNHMALAREYNISVNAIYRVIKRTRKRAIARNQPDMFEASR